MKMKKVCSVFENAGMQKVQSVLASGNIIFDSDIKATDVKILLEKAMSQAFDYDANLFLSDKTQLTAIIQNNPFEINKENHIYVFLGVKNIEKILLDSFNKENAIQGENAAISKGYFYWQIPKGGTLGSPFSKVLGRKDMKDKFTSRNINTVEKVLHKMN